MKVYHGTSMSNAAEILQHGFRIKEKEVVNDLGNGIYTYCDDWYHIWDPAENAARYARQYCNGKVAVLELDLAINADGANILDLDQPDLMKKWKLFRDLLEKRANQRWRQFTPGKAKRRHNLDGIILDVAINEHRMKNSKGQAINPDCLVKNTYTSFIPHTQSNFPNGCELVIFNPNLINGVKERR